MICASYIYLYAIKSFRKEDGKCTTKVVEKFGTIEKLREKLGGEDPIEWARAKGVGGIARQVRTSPKSLYHPASQRLIYYKV